MAEVNGEDVLEGVKLIARAIDGLPEAVAYSSLLATALLMLSDKVSGDDVKEGVIGASQWLQDFVNSKEQGIINV